MGMRLSPGRPGRPSGREQRCRATGGGGEQRRLALAVSGMILLGSALLGFGYWLQAGRHSVPVEAVSRPSAAGPEEAKGERWVVVQPGDTLWSLAVRHAPDGADPRQYVDAIVRLNPGTDAGRLRPGQALSLPHP